MKHVSIIRRVALGIVSVGLLVAPMATSAQSATPRDRAIVTSGHNAADYGTDLGKGKGKGKGPQLPGSGIGTIIGMVAIAAAGGYSIRRASKSGVTAKA